MFISKKAFIQSVQKAADEAIRIEREKVAHNQEMQRLWDYMYKHDEKIFKMEERLNKLEHAETSNKVKVND